MVDRMHADGTRALDRWEQENYWVRSGGIDEETVKKVLAVGEGAARDAQEQIAQLVEASVGYDLPSFKSMYDLPTWKNVEPPKGVVYSYPPRGDEQTSMFGAPARAEVGAQMYNQAINTVMVAKVSQATRACGSSARSTTSTLVVP